MASSGSSAATSLTKSPSFFASARSTMSLANSSSRGSSALIDRGVKARCTMLRYWLCSGGSMLSISMRVISSACSSSCASPVCSSAPRS